MKFNNVILHIHIPSHIPWPSMKCTGKPGTRLPNYPCTVMSAPNIIQFELCVFTSMQTSVGNTVQPCEIQKTCCHAEFLYIVDHSHPSTSVFDHHQKSTTKHLVYGKRNEINCGRWTNLVPSKRFCIHIHMGVMSVLSTFSVGHQCMA